MSIENNKHDFERSLSELDSVILKINDQISAPDYDSLESVSAEYNGHYKDDIESLISELENVSSDLEDVKNELSESNNRLNELENEVDSLNETVIELNQEIEDSNI